MILLFDIFEKQLNILAFFTSESDDPNRRRYQRQRLVCDAPNREHNDIIYQYHRWGQQNALSEPLRVAVDNEKAIDDKPENAEQGMRALICENTAHTHHRRENTEPYPHILFAPYEKKTTNIAQKTYYIKRKAYRSSKKQITDTGCNRRRTQDKENLLFRVQLIWDYCHDRRNNADYLTD